MFKSKTIKEMQLGDRESISFTVTEENVSAFAKATGDYNPLHMEEEYACKTQFGRRIAHGVLMTGIVSGLLGTKFPGLGTVAREMTSKFSRPVYIGDTVEVTAELVDMNEKINTCTFKYYIKDKEGKVAVKGTAVVFPKK